MNKIKGFSTKTEKAMYKWAKFFLWCHPKIKVHKSINLSTAQAQCANESNIKKWFTEYEKVLDDFNITAPDQIWSGDETGVQNVPKEQLVVGEEGTPSVTQVSGKQGETSTILTFVNAVGLQCLPMVIHHGKHIQEYWVCDAPIDAHVAATTKWH